MKKTAKLLLAATLFAAATASSAAEFLTVAVKARVSGIYDESNILGGQVAVGEAVTGSYTYDLRTRDRDDSSTHGFYLLDPGSVKLTAGPLTFENIDPTLGLGAPYVEVQPSPGPGQGGFFSVRSDQNRPLPNGVEVWKIEFYFSDFTGDTPSSDALLTTTPDLRDFPYHKVYLYGGLNDQTFSIVLDIESTQSAGVESDLVISPGKSTFVRDQRIDVALLLPPGSEPSSATARIDGELLPMRYPGDCHLAPPNSQDRPTIICPNVLPLLPASGGTLRVDWQVDLFNARMLENSVEWTVIP